VAGPGAVDAQQDLDRLDERLGDLLKGLINDGDLIDDGVRTGVARTQFAGQRLTGLIAIGQQ